MTRVKQRLLILGDLGWQIELTEVAGWSSAKNLVLKNNSDVSKLEAKTWTTGPNCGLEKTIRVLGDRRFELSVGGTVGDDELSLLLMNWLDRQGIDTTWLATQPESKLPLTIKLGSKISQDDDMAIATSDKMRLIDPQVLYRLKNKHDVYLIEYQQLDLSWLNEILHQAVLNQVPVMLKLQSLARRDFARFKLLLEDVEWLIVPSQLLQKIFATIDRSELARKLTNVVKNTIYYDERSIGLIYNGNWLVADWGRAKLKIDKESVVRVVQRELILKKKPSQAIMTALIDFCAGEVKMPQIEIVEQKI